MSKEWVIIGVIFMLFIGVGVVGGIKKNRHPDNYLYDTLNTEGRRIFDKYYALCASNCQFAGSTVARITDDLECECTDFEDAVGCPHVNATT